ncbi:MAG: hypothetical protein QXU97_05970 [Fervidicoccaceae archaeon]
MRVELEVAAVRRLSELFYPSFASPLFDIDESGALKRWGHCRGLVVKVLGSRKYAVSHELAECLEYAIYVVGAWLDLERAAKTASKRGKRILEALSEAYEGFGIATSPLDDRELFASIFLSRNTNYHTNTVKWMRKILELHGGLVGEPPSTVSRSYQVGQLPEALECYAGLRSLILEKRSWRELLLCRNVGPKTSRAFALHVLLEPRVAPLDVNAERLASYLGIKRWKMRPNKALCLANTCSSCPARSNCGGAAFEELFGDAAGWVQTIAFVHVDAYCSRGACASCPLAEMCHRDPKIQ